MGLFDLFKRKKAGAPEQDAPESSTTPVSAASVDAPEAEAPPAAPPAAPPLAPTLAEKLPSTAAAPAAPAKGPSRLQQALNRTRAFLATAFSTDNSGTADEAYYQEMHDGLVISDIGTELGLEMIQAIRAEMSARGLVLKRDVPAVARDVIARMLRDVREPVPLDPAKPSVILLVGVNGSGKTTLAAKLARRLKDEGRSVLLAAADTFRAAATDQLRIWAERAGVDIVSGAEGGDPASVVFDAAQAAQARGTEVLIVDTAGRLQNKSGLMAELSKIVRTVDKAFGAEAGSGAANIAHILVLDATVGQNALSQAELFNQCCPLTGVAMNKLDGSAKGGALLAVVRLLRTPVLYVGVGEGIEDLVDFDAADFAAGLWPE
ncbi:signal recognition particle-docking protein FtsY [bacterium]|nr:signal recognition particle-docking protein FtsY [bacterium]